MTDEAEPMEDDTASPPALSTPSSTPAEDTFADRASPGHPASSQTPEEAAAASADAHENTEQGSVAAPPHATGDPARAADRAAAADRPRLPPPNLVTSWGPSAPARRVIASALLAGPAAPNPAGAPITATAVQPIVCCTGLSPGAGGGKHHLGGRSERTITLFLHAFSRPAVPCCYKPGN